MSLPVEEVSEIRGLSFEDLFRTFLCVIGILYELAEQCATVMNWREIQEVNLRWNRLAD